MISPAAGVASDAKLNVVPIFTIVSENTATASCNPNSEFIFNDSFVMTPLSNSVGTRALIKTRINDDFTIAGDKREYLVTYIADRGSYIATLIVSPDSRFLHHTSNKYAETAKALIPQIADLTVCTGSNSDVSDAMQQMIGHKQIFEMSVYLGSETTPYTVRLIFKDGSFAIMAFSQLH